MLAGSDTVRDSLETIRPGEVALIKVTSAVIPPRDSHIAGLALFAQADYRLKTGPFVEWQDLRFDQHLSDRISASAIAPHSLSQDRRRRILVTRSCKRNC